MRTVLILDDEDAVRESLECYFQDRDWRVIVAASTEEALPLVETEHPDIAVVDIRLPGMDGNAFIILASRISRDMSFVVATGSSEYRLSGDVAALRRVSRDVFVKPIMELERLEDAMIRLLEQPATGRILQ